MSLIKLVFNMIWFMQIKRFSNMRNKAFKIASDPKYDGYQRGLASMVYKSFDKNFCFA